MHRSEYNPNQRIRSQILYTYTIVNRGAPLHCDRKQHSLFQSEKSLYAAREETTFMTWNTALFRNRAIAMSTSPGWPKRSRSRLAGNVPQRV
jgi:hypothetical protein